VGSDTVWNIRTSVIVLVEEVAAMLAAELIVSVEPDAGEKVTLEVLTCV
jgi:hypothetical protein